MPTDAPERTSPSSGLGAGHGRPHDTEPGIAMSVVSVVEATDVTDEIMELIYSIVDGWYQSGRIDWEDVIDRAEDMGDLDFGDSMVSPAIKKIKSRIRRER